MEFYNFPFFKLFMVTLNTLNMSPQLADKLMQMQNYELLMCIKLSTPLNGYCISHIRFM